MLHPSKKLIKSQKTVFQLIEHDKIFITGPFIQEEQQQDELQQEIIKLGGKWLDNYSGFELHRSQYETSKKILSELNVFYEEIPDFVFKSIQPIPNKLEIKQGKKTLSTIYYSPSDLNKNIQELPQSILQPLYEYQQQSIYFAIQNYCRILLADEMGTGKTFQSLAISYIYKDSFPLLIIVPSALRNNWKKEVLLRLPDIKENQVQVITKKGQGFQINFKILIVSYELSQAYEEPLLKQNFQIAIADEVHYLKNIKTKRSLVMIPILQKCKHLILLTGTPALNKPRELFSIFQIIRPDLFPNFYKYGERYCDPQPSNFGNYLEYEGATNTLELNFILNQNIMIRRLKKDILVSLPQKSREAIYIEVDIKKRQEITKLLNNFKENSSQIDEIFNEEHSNQRTLEPKSNKYQMFENLQQASSLSCQSKISGVCNFLSQFKNKSQKFLVFAEHQEMLNAIQLHFNNNNIQHVRIDGQVEMNQREQRLLQFKNDSSCQAAILSIRAVGIGLDFTMTNVVIFAELLWTPALLIQAEDRVHRIGQDKDVRCIYLIGKGTLDEIIYNKLGQKFTTLSNIIDGNDKKDFEKNQNIQLQLQDPTCQQFQQKQTISSNYNNNKLQQFLQSKPKNNFQRDIRSVTEVNQSQNQCEKNNQITNYFKKKSSLQDSTTNNCDNYNKIKINNISNNNVQNHNNNKVIPNNFQLKNKSELNQNQKLSKQSFQSTNESEDDLSYIQNLIEEDEKNQKIKTNNKSKSDDVQFKENQFLQQQLKTTNQKNISLPQKIQNKEQLVEQDQKNQQIYKINSENNKINDIYYQLGNSLFGWMEYPFSSDQSIQQNNSKKISKKNDFPKENIINQELQKNKNNEIVFKSNYIQNDPNQKLKFQNIEQNINNDKQQTTQMNCQVYQNQSTHHKNQTNQMQIENQLANTPNFAKTFYQQNNQMDQETNIVKQYQNFNFEDQAKNQKENYYQQNNQQKQIQTNYFKNNNNQNKTHNNIQRSVKYINPNLLMQENQNQNLKQTQNQYNLLEKNNQNGFNQNQIEEKQFLDKTLIIKNNQKEEDLNKLLDDSLFKSKKRQQFEEFVQKNKKDNDAENFKQSFKRIKKMN